MIFQEPQSCLDPSERIGRQLMPKYSGLDLQRPLVAAHRLAQTPCD
jgi:ABC-type microcin C transport system duplicated ATPase subunit YejF